MKEPILKISRSFSRTIQVKQYEPASFFCALEHTFYDTLPTQAKLQEVADKLYEFCRDEVHREMKEYLKAKEKQVAGEDAPY